uniref:Uncharacterized protein n=1 Tax=Arundo donax TaxID=35708 RepID=A0A0A9FAB5_ARUDO
MILSSSATSSAIAAARSVPLSRREGSLAATSVASRKAARRVTAAVRSSS